MSTAFIRSIACLVALSIVLSPAAMLAAPETSDETIHIVQWGETLILIANRYGVSVQAIMAVNGLADPDLIYVGQRLVIPTSGHTTQGGRHIVIAGETLTSIALRYGTSVAALAAANGLDESDFIYVGQALVIPNQAVPESAPVSGGCAAYYTVQRGDTLSGIAWQHQTTLNALMQANSLYNDFIYQGQRLCVPQTGAAWGPAMPEPSPTGPPMHGPSPGPEPGPQYTYYTVRPSDTLMTIAWQFGVSQAAILQANNLANPSLIHVGQRLVIPDIGRHAPMYQIAAIAFARWDGGKHNLYIARTDGSGEKLLLERAAGPSWSPNGQSLSFYGAEGVDRQTMGGAPVVFEGISNGILVVRLTNWPSDLNQLKLIQIRREGTARATAWSPNGKVIAWDAKPGKDYRIYFYGQEGTDFEGQSAIEIPGEQPDWSPDGNHIIYRSGREGKQGLWVSDRFDSFHERITNDGSDAFPRWSPDGQGIAFQREVDGNVDIYVMPAPGATHPPAGKADPRRVSPPGPGGPGQPGGIWRLTNAPGPDTLPAWTPDGYIVFRSARSGSWGIYIMSADGNFQQPIIPNADPGPDWTLGRLDVHPLH